MDIQTAAGSFVRFLGRNGYDSERVRACQELGIGNVFEVESMEVGRSSSEVILKNNGKRYNSVMFENVEKTYWRMDWFSCSYPTRGMVMGTEPWPTPRAPTRVEMGLDEEEGTEGEVYLPVETPVEDHPTDTKPITHVITTMCRGADHRSFIDVTDEEAFEGFMDQFGEEPTETIKNYVEQGTRGFDPASIRGRVTRVYYED